MDIFIMENNVLLCDSDGTIDKVYIMCNFNVSLLQYLKSKSVADFYSNILTHGLYPLITKPTQTTVASATLDEKKNPTISTVYLV